MEFLIILVIVAVVDKRRDRVKASFAKQREVHASRFRREHPDWTDRRVEWAAHWANRAWWGHEIRQGFPTWRQEFSDGFDQIRVEREKRRLNADRTHGTYRAALHDLNWKRRMYQREIDDGHTKLPFETWYAQQSGNAEPGSQSVKPEHHQWAKTRGIPRGKHSATCTCGVQTGRHSTEQAMLDEMLAHHHAPQGNPAVSKTGSQKPPAAPGSTPQGTPGPAPQAAPGPTPGPVPQNIPQAAPRPAPGSTPQDTPGPAPQAAPGKRAVVTKPGTMTVDPDGKLHLDGWEIDNPNIPPGTYNDSSSFNGYTVQELHALAHGTNCTCSVSKIQDRKMGLDDSDVKTAVDSTVASKERAAAIDKLVAEREQAGHDRDAAAEEAGRHQRAAAKAATTGDTAKQERSHELAAQELGKQQDAETRRAEAIKELGKLEPTGPELSAARERAAMLQPGSPANRDAETAAAKPSDQSPPGTVVQNGHPVPGKTIAAGEVQGSVVGPRSQTTGGNNAGDGNPTNNGGQPVTATDIPDGTLEGGDSRYRSAIAAVDKFSEIHAVIGASHETMEGVLTSLEFDRDSNLIGLVRAIEDDIEGLKGKTVQLRGEFLKHEPGAVYHEGGEDAKAEAFRPTG